MSLLLGLDVGTSSVKAVLFAPDEAVVLATAGQEYPLRYPQPGHVEQDAGDWWLAAQAVVQRVCAQTGRHDVAAIGLSGQMHGGVLLDEQHQPLHRAIIWADQRSGDAAAALVETVGRARYAALAGTLPAAGFLAATAHWLRQHDPALLDRARAFVLPKDYVRLHLTGEVATDVSDAASTALFDISRRVWSTELAQAAGMPERALPPVLASAAVAGQLTTQAAEPLGLPAGIPVVAGCADQPAQAIGNGLITPGIASVTVGTGGQVFLPLRPASGEAIATDPRLHVFNHAVPQTWYVLGATLAAGLSLRWLRNLTGLSADPDAYPVLSAAASDVPPGADGLLFLPYLAGERAPHMDPLARGAFVGLSLHHERGHLARAVMEGVAFSLRQALAIGLALAGDVETLIAAGGGAQSAVWRQIMADVFGVPLQQTLLAEQAGVGAALLAGVGAGRYADLDEACQSVVRYGPVTHPDPARQAIYAGLYQQFSDLYPRLRDDFHKLAVR